VPVEWTTRLADLRGGELSAQMRADKRRPAANRGQVRNRYSFA